MAAVINRTRGRPCGRCADEDWERSCRLRGVLEQQDEAMLDRLRRVATEKMRPFKVAARPRCHLRANLVRARRPRLV